MRPGLRCAACCFLTGVSAADCVLLSAVLCPGRLLTRLALLVVERSLSLEVLVEVARLLPDAVPPVAVRLLPGAVALVAGRVRFV